MTQQKKSNHTQKGSSKKKKRKVKLGTKFSVLLKVLLLLILACVVALFALFYVKYGKTILEMQSKAKTYVWNSDLDTFRQYQSSMFYDVNGDLISELSGEREVYYINYEDIPSNVVNAIVTIEDKRFFEHEGVDFIANVRAAVALIKNEGKVTQGASTITQQLARNIFLSNEVSMERKVTEIFIASEMEKKYSKQQILEFYLNNIYFANGYYGIAAAAEGYFGIGVQELSLSQAAFLCAIPNSPTMYNPVTNKDNTITRRDKILKQMYEDGVITKTEYEDAVDEEITVQDQTSTINNYVESYVYQCAIESLMEANGFELQYEFDSDEDESTYKENYQEEYDTYQQALYTGGYRVYTSIDLEKQEELQEAVDENLSGFTSTGDDGVYELQGSAVCIDNESGRVVAIVGGRSQDFTSYTLNRAYQSYRQPGSSIKPLIVYTPYFELGGTPDDIVTDEKTEDGPKNSDGTYSGNITVRYAVEQSKNTIAWKLFEELTPKVGLAYLTEMNFKKICSDDEVLAASLGGLTYGTNTLEMASAYAAIENDGVYRTPTCIVRICDAQGEVIIEPEITTKQVYETNAARTMTDVLTGVMTSGTGSKLQLTNMISAGKTGTTSDKKDGWFVGYTAYYTTAVWVGYDYPKTISDLYGSTYPGYIWQQFMNAAHEGLESKEFTAYEDTWSVKEEDTEEEDVDEEEIEEEEEESEEDALESEEEDLETTSEDETTPTDTITPTATPTPTQTPEAEEEEDDGENIVDDGTNPGGDGSDTDDGAGTDDSQDGGASDSTQTPEADSGEEGADSQDGSATTP